MMRHLIFIKKPTLQIALAGFFFVLSACQKLDVTPSHCADENDAACAKKIATPPSRPKKTKYRRQFNADPHHRSKARQVVSIDESAATTFSANNPDYKHRNYLQSVINPSAHDPQLLRYQEKLGQARLRAGSLQIDALYARAQKEFKQSLSNEFSTDKALSLPLFAYGVDSGLALKNVESTLAKVYAYLSPYRPGFVTPEHFPGEKDGFQIAAVGKQANLWPQNNDRMHWVLAFLKVRHLLSSEQRKELELAALRALKTSIELDRAAAFDGVLGLYEGVDKNGPRTGSQRIRENKNFRVNAFNYLALKTAAELAKKYQDSVASVKYGDWSVDLRNAINQHFWDLRTRRYRAFLFDKDSDALDQAYAIVFGVADDYTARIALQSLDQSEEFFTSQESAYLLRAASFANYAPLINKIFHRFMEEYSSNTFYAREDVSKNTASLFSSVAYLSLISDGVFGLKFNYKGLDMTPTMTVGMHQRYFPNVGRIKLHDVNLDGKRFNFIMVLPKLAKGVGKYRVKNVRVNGVNVAGTLHWHELKDDNTVVVTLSGQTHSYQMATPQDGVYVSPTKDSKNDNKSSLLVAETPIDGRSLGSQALGSAASGSEVLLQTDIVIETEGSYQFRYAYTLPDLRKQNPHAHGIKWLDLLDAQGRVLASKVIHFPARKRTNQECQSSPLLAHLAPGRYSLRMRDFFHMSYLEVNAQHPTQNNVIPVALCTYREGAG